MNITTFLQWHNYIVGEKNISEMFVDNQEDKKGEDKMNKPTHEELREAAKPLLEIINNYYNPHTSVIVTNRNVKIVTDDISVPVESIN